MSARGGKKRQKAMSKSQRANVTFPVGRMHRYLKMGTHRLRIGVGSPVYMAAVIEYLTGKNQSLKIAYKELRKNTSKEVRFWLRNIYSILFFSNFNKLIILC
jgi:Histone H2A